MTCYPLITLVNFQCGWTSFVRQQIHHNNIALKSDGNELSGGYTYSEIIEIWHAANETKSDLIGLWWVPEPTVNSFMGSGSDFTLVTLPPSTKECMENRIDPLKRCDPDATEFDLVGDEKGACKDPYDHLMKVAVGNMGINIKENSNPKSRMSPAYDVYNNFYMNEIEIEEILNGWTERGQDKWNFDLRWSTCKWVTENLEHIIESFIPEDHPQTIRESETARPMRLTAVFFSVIAITMCLSTAGGIFYLHEKGKLERAAQLLFLVLLLAGLLSVSIGALLLALEPSDGSCIGAIWMINVGYTAQLVPTLMRVSTIISIVQASMKMKVVKVDQQRLLVKSIGMSAFAAIYCSFWTAFDPPQPQTSVHVTHDKNDLGETIVSVSHYCDSGSSLWFMGMFIGQALLLIGASVLAYQMRKVPTKVNDSLELAAMIYSSFVSLVLRFLLYVIAGTASGVILGKSSLQKSRSLLCSIDTIAGIFIFFTRFFRPKNEGGQNGPWAYFVSRLSIYGQNGASHRRYQSTRSNGVSNFAFRHSFQLDAMPSWKKERARDVDPSETVTSGPLVAMQAMPDIVDVEEEKEEEDSPTISLRLQKNQVITLPKWVLEKHGVVEESETRASLCSKPSQRSLSVGSF
mmetsp:Transcript_43896/g.93377  ORF Transcript_43896/g.93377 Transcript_43896/m.93377 type:complete len:632 (-) Transcript_43896:102-1997(-)